MERSNNNPPLSEDQNSGLTPAENKKILKARAKNLAREPVKEEAAGEYIEIIEFLLANERYAIETVFIREVYGLKVFTPMPCTPPYVLGVINVRGQIISVIDIKKFFNLPEKGLSDLNKTIILHEGDMEFGLLADKILSVRSILLKDIQPSLPTLKDKRVDYLRGVTEDRMIILDAKKILNDKSIIVHEEIDM